MPEPDGERELSARRDTAHRGTAGGERDSETRQHPPAYVLDEELLVRFRRTIDGEIEQEFAGLA